LHGEIRANRKTRSIVVPSITALASRDMGVEACCFSPSSSVSMRIATMALTHSQAMMASEPAELPASLGTRHRNCTEPLPGKPIA